MQAKLKTVYEGIMILLVMLTIITLWSENTYNSTINWIVWSVFFIDFLYRFFTTTSKWQFVKNNPFLLLAIIPFDQFFQVARIVRIIYLFRIKTIAKYYITPYVNKITYKSMTMILAIILLLLLLESYMILAIEDSIHTYLDALYITYSHLFFFGHKIFEINKMASVWVLTCTSIIGIAIQGLALQWGFSKMETITKRIKGI